MTKRPASELETMVQAQTMIASPAAVTEVGVVSGAASSIDLAKGPAVFADRYEVQGLLGSGGMGTVYLARDRELDDLVALKVLRAEIAGSEQLVELFRREVRIARKITHPNVARVFDIGASGAARFLTMEYIDGPSLARVIEKSGALDLARAIELALGICAGLEAAHGASVVHRDLKPDNVLISKSGRVAITDFGIARPMDLANAKMTMGVTLGTPAYMAPEQVEACSDIDRRADIYAFGVLLFELLTGALPFTGNSPLAIAAMRLSVPPRDPKALRPDLPDPLARLVLKCLARERDQRFATAAEVASALATITQPAKSVVGSSRSRADSVATLPPAARSVAVLPFTHSGTPDDALVAEGLADDLLDALSMIDGLRVRARAAVTRQREQSGTSTDGVSLGQALGVDLVVEGSLRRARGQLRVTVRVVGVAEGFQLWAERFEEEPSELFALSDTIAFGIARVLGIEAAPPKRQKVADTTAVELYLLARQEQRRAFVGDPSKTLELFEKALERAPEDPTILAGYALANVRLWFFGFADPERAAVNALRAASRALELAPHLADARHALAQVHLHSGDPSRALAELRHVLERSDFCAAHETLGSVLHEIGMVDDARRHLQTALAIEPTSAFAVHELARIHALEGDWGLAYERLDRFMALAGPDAEIARTLKARLAFWRRDEEAGRLLANAPQGTSVGPVPQILLEVFRAGTTGGSPGPVREIFRSFKNVGGSMRRKAILQQLSCEAAGLFDDAEWGLEALDAAIEFELIDITWLTRCPVLESLRAAPGFESRLEIVRGRAERLATIIRAR